MMALLITNEMITEFKMIFDILDWDDKGYLTADQLSAIMKQYGYDSEQEEVQKMIDLVDCDGSGHMGFSTFCGAIMTSMNIKSSRAINSPKE